MEATYTCHKCRNKWRRSQLKQVTAKGSDYQPAMLIYTCPKCKQGIFTERIRGVRS